LKATLLKDLKDPFPKDKKLHSTLKHEKGTAVGGAAPPSAEAFATEVLTLILM
jgi:hypothetical protein